MGAGMPGGLDQEKQDKMQKVVTDVGGLFVKNFAIAFAIEVAVSAKEALNPPLTGPVNSAPRPIRGQNAV